MAFPDRESLRGLSLDHLRQASISSDHPSATARKQLTPRNSLSARQHSHSPATTFVLPPQHASDKDIPPVGTTQVESVRPTSSTSTLPYDFSFPFHSPIFNMAREQEPPRPPLGTVRGNAAPPSQAVTRPADQEEQPRKLHVPELPKPYNNDQTSRPVQFGAPSPLGPQRQQNVYRPSPPMPTSNTSVPRQPPADKYSNLFISKGARPELHKPKMSINPFNQLKDKVEHKVQDFVDGRLGGPAQSQHQQPTSYTQTSNMVTQTQYEDPFAMPKPPTWRPNPTQPQMFSSGVNTNPHFQPKPSTFVDLTKTNHSQPVYSNLYNRIDESASDPMNYMDAAKANESLKALLEGAFEDEDDKPRTRRRKKQQDADANGLANEMQSMKVDEVEAEEEEEEEDDGSIEGLKVKLLPHQIAGVAWMQDKERGTKKTKGIFPKGGILADDMGLGKTIQSIALILTNRKPTAEEMEKNPRQKVPQGVDKGTLVVAPLALIKQWEGEIKDRVESTHALKVCVHHGPKRAKSFKDLKKYDVVITTYQTLSSEHADSEGDLKVGCYGINWYRIILDEAHSIKNRNAKATKAACGLNGEYRWCLTGTPMQNNLDELQSLVHFLRIKPYESLDIWREQITRPMNSGRGGLAIKRLRAVLQAFMKRRTKDVLKQDGGLKTGTKGNQQVKSAGFKIVNRTVESIAVEFTPEERAFYTRLESRTDKSLEMMMAGNKMSYASALVLLLRLRQACNHPRLTGSDLSSEKESTTGTGSATPSRKKAAAAEDMDSIADMLGGLSVQTKRCDMCQIELNANEAAGGAVRCAECEADLAQQVMTVQHTDKKKRKPTKKAASKAKPLREKRKQARRVIDDSDDEATDRDTSDQDDVNSDSDEEEEDDSIYGSDSSSEFTLTASTKIRHLISLLTSTTDPCSEYKYIIFSFFTSMLDLIEPFLLQKRIDYVRYDGAMRNDAREASLESLRSNPKTRVLLCSLRAGSLGLNLTAALTSSHSRALLEPLRRRTSHRSCASTQPDARCQSVQTHYS